MKIAIVANGRLGSKAFHRKVLRESDMVIAADGGANNCNDIGITPDYVIGDMDSIRKPLRRKLENNTKTVVVEDPDQDKTDTELAIELAHAFKPDEIVFLCCTGTRIDHTLANIACLEKVGKGIKASMLDEKNEIFLVHDSIRISGKKDDIISVIPIGNVNGLSYKGLKWNVKGLSVRFGWIGICNRMTGRKAEISLKRGSILVIRSAD